MQTGQGRLYVVEFHNVSVAAQQDFFYLKPAADKPIIIEAVYLSNVGGATLVGDAKEAMWDVEILRLPSTVTASSGGASATPTPSLPSDAAAGFTARVNDTTKATTTGTALNLHSDGINDRIPFVYLPPPEHHDPVPNPFAVVVRLNTTPSAGVAMNGTCRVRELC